MEGSLRAAPGHCRANSRPPTACERDWESEITVTLGATEAIFSAIQAVVGAGDEVIVFDPAYDSYDPAIRLAGGRCVHIPLLAAERSAMTGSGLRRASRRARA